MSDELTSQEVVAGQGTRLSDVPPWMSYAAEMETKLDPELEKAVEEYSQHRHQKTSSQSQEELHRQHELSEDVAKQYQFLQPSEYADEGPRVGKVMSHAEFITKLRKNGIKCWYRDHPHRDKVVLVYSDPSGAQPPQLGCWVQYGLMPEYSFMRFDHYGVPLNEKRRGWRTCLLQLIMKNVIGERKAHEIFGPAQGPASGRYNRTLWGLRNTYKD